MADPLEDFDEDELVADLPQKQDTPASAATTRTGLSPLQEIGAAANLPSRVARAGAVGVQKAMEGTDVIPSLVPGQGTLTDPAKLAAMGKNVIPALQRGKEAFQPGFQPTAEEQPGVTAAEIAGQVPLALATGGESVAAGLSRKFLFSALKNAGGGALISSIEQASEKGDVDLWDVSMVAGTGAMLPVLKPAGKMLGRFIKAFTRESVVAGTSVSREAASEVLENPKAMKEALGTAQRVSEGAVKIQEAISRRIDQAGEALSKARKVFGIGQVDDTVNTLQQSGFTERTEQDILDDATDYLVGRRSVKSPNTPGGVRTYEADVDVSDELKTVRTKGGTREIAEEVGEEADLGGGKGTPVFKSRTEKYPGSTFKIRKAEIDPATGFEKPVFETRKVKTYEPPKRGSKSYTDPHTGGRVPRMSLNERVKGLYETRKELDAYITWRKGNPDLPPMSDSQEAPFRAMRKAINRMLDGMADSNPAVKRLRDQDEIYSTTRELYDRLQANFADEAKGEQTLIRIAKGDNPDEIIGLTSGLVDRIRLLEKESKQKLLDPLRREILKYNLKNMKGKTPVRGAAIEAFGGAEHVLNAARETSSILQRIMGGLTNPAARGAIVSGQQQRRNP